MVAYDQAICHCETIKDKALSYVKKAECYYDYKMFKEAEVFFKKAWLDLDPRYFAFNKGFIHSIYGIVLCELKKYDEAMEMLIDAVEQLPEDGYDLKIKLLIKVGRLYMYHYKNLPEAYEAFKKADDLTRQYPDQKCCNHGAYTEFHMDFNKCVTELNKRAKDFFEEEEEKDKDRYSIQFSKLHGDGGPNLPEELPHDCNDKQCHGNMYMYELSLTPENGQSLMKVSMSHLRRGMRRNKPLHGFMRAIQCYKVNMFFKQY
jgi:tetratricopeptide (TPR) repeat protein